MKKFIFKLIKNKKAKNILPSMNNTMKLSLYEFKLYEMPFLDVSKKENSMRKFYELYKIRRSKYHF
jgi:hypothetical protein